VSLRLPPVDREPAAPEPPTPIASPAGVASSFLASPCVGTCRLDPETGWCIGCARSREELAAWRDLDAAARARVWSVLPGRKPRLGLAFRLEPWTAAEALARLARRIEGEAPLVAMGPWVRLAVHKLRLTAGTLEIAGKVGRIVIRSDPSLRLFRLVGPGAEVVLAIHRSRLPPVAGVVSEGGPDADALDPEARAAVRFDLGVVVGATRLAVRARDQDAIRHWRGQCGRRFAADVVAGDVTWIVTTPVGRAELAAGPDLAASSPFRGLPESYVACLAC
jgi:predicted Fe-S protein YdhL (DUF1289 family)